MKNIWNLNGKMMHLKSWWFWQHACLKLWNAGNSLTSFSPNGATMNSEKIANCKSKTDSLENWTCDRTIIKSLFLQWLLYLIICFRIPIDLRESVFCLAMKNADMRERDFLFELYKSEIDRLNLNNVILNALGCSGKKDILEK